MLATGRALSRNRSIRADPVANVYSLWEFAVFYRGIGFGYTVLDKQTTICNIAVSFVT